mgnify:CR=1 FL=1|jgi:putative membrane protein
MNMCFLHSIYSIGSEPDPRFSLANERTLLAWLRTSLALISLAVALDNVTISMWKVAKTVIVVELLIMGLVLPLTAWGDWRRKERAMRLRLPLPLSVSQLVLLGGVMICTLEICADMAWNAFV